MGCISSQQLPPPNPNQVDLSHFVVHRVLGRGGFGKVNAVQRRSDEQFFAMKTISKHKLIRKEHSVQMTWLERQVMSSFHSPFLVTCLHAFQDPHNLYMVMPLMLGGDLRYFLKQNGPCRESEARFFMAEILLALEHMHSLSIIYRDLKPDNCLLDEQGHIRLSDFGLSGRLRSGDGKTSGFCGTWGYIAPEVREGKRYDGSCDFYAFGVVMYELLCRYVPSRVKDERQRLSMEEAMMGKKREQASPLPSPSPDPPTDSPFSDLFDPRLTRKQRGLTPACIDLLTGLLQDEPTLRLGSRSTSRWDEVKSHEWFASVDWTVASRRELTPVFRPNVDVANCDPVWELEEQIMGQGGKVKGELTAEEQARFVGWEWRVKVGGEEGGEEEVGGLSLDEVEDVQGVANDEVQVEMKEEGGEGVVEYEPQAVTPGEVGWTDDPVYLTQGPTSFVTQS